jgi:hypothetical protein
MADAWSAALPAIRWESWAEPSAALETADPVTLPTEASMVPISYTVHVRSDDEPPTPLGDIQLSRASASWCLPQLLRLQQSPDPAWTVLATTVLQNGLHRVHPKLLRSVAMAHMHDAAWAAAALAVVTGDVVHG